MALIKVLELMTESEKGWEDAAQMAVAEAAKTVRNIRSIYVKEFNAVVENDKIVRYRVDAKVSFAVES